MLFYGAGMIFKQLYLGCLAHASYIIADGGEAAVVDPQRDVDEYIDFARDNGLTIKYIIETHIHADFVSGHNELAKKTGARIVFSEKARAHVDHIAVADGDTLRLGSIDLKILATPGHTPESICVLIDACKPPKLMTGDTLFIGDVGRPDLAANSDADSSDMAAQLYDSLHSKIMTLPDETEIYPAHGAGSLCGKNISQDRMSTLGIQKQFNWALKAPSKQQFVETLTRDLPEVPAYFKRAVAHNKKGAVALDELHSPQAVSPDGLNGYQILDTRDSACFGEGHIAGAINIGLDGQFASWCGILLDLDQPICLVAADEESQGEALIRLSRAGIENVTALIAPEALKQYLEAGKGVSLPQMTVAQLADRIAGDSAFASNILDVRRPGEYSQGHIAGTRNISLAELKANLQQLREHRPIAIICQGGYRSSMAASILMANGFTDLINVRGGFGAWKKEGFPITLESPGVVCSN